MLCVLYMKTLLIGTTAINRSALHNDNISEWYDYINALDRTKYNIRWFINIDYIEKLEEIPDETMSNFQNIISDIPMTFIKKETKDGNFLTACKRVSSAIEQYVIENELSEEDVAVFWLEDDWKLNKNNIPLHELLDTYLTDMVHINLSFIRLNYIHALAPSILSYKLWSKVHLSAWKNQSEHIDPEHCVGLYFMKTFGVEYQDVHNITLISRHKKHSATFFDSTWMNQQHSLYTYHEPNESSFILDRYIPKEDISTKFGNTPLFIRITSSCCSDYGREFMKKRDLEKRIQTNNEVDFYK